MFWWWGDKMGNAGQGVCQLACCLGLMHQWLKMTNLEVTLTCQLFLTISMKMVYLKLGGINAYNICWMNQSDIAISSLF